MVSSFPCAGLQGLLSPQLPALCYGLMEQAPLKNSTGRVPVLPLYYKAVAAGRLYLNLSTVYTMYERLYSEGSRARHSCCKCVVWVYAEKIRKDG